jgi:hypothetical protein
MIGATQHAARSTQHAAVLCAAHCLSYGAGGAKVHLGNCGIGVTDPDVRALFGPCGAIASIKVSEKQRGEGEGLISAAPSPPSRCPPLPLR